MKKRLVTQPFHLRELFLIAMNIDQAVIQSLDVENTNMVDGEFLFQYVKVLIWFASCQRVN
ncbi:hypothetical protein [Paenibacillus pini]|uniref:hypothetical protein n=1 Tax=Paenibacillus pini TaxID=669461 RepID=UPI0011DE4BE4|nr:hypothetical protein [Paenibacillus pini]